MTEIKADPLIKQRIAQGEFNAELVWLVKCLARTLSPEANPTTELEPRPQFMKDMEAECAEGGAAERFGEFVETKTTPCDRKSATPVTAFKAALADFLGISKAQAGSVMTAKGYATKGVSNGVVRVAVGFHPERGLAKGDGLQLKT